MKMSQGEHINRGERMRFLNSHDAITKQQILSISDQLGLSFPKDLLDIYEGSNGGTPEPYVYEDDNLDTVVVEFLPLVSTRQKRTAVESYANLVRSKKIVPPNLFPFAMDGGGDYFFIDCNTPIGEVYFFRSDRSSGSSPLVALNLGIRSFWESMKPED